MATKPKTVCNHPTCSALSSGRYCATHAPQYEARDAARREAAWEKAAANRRSQRSSSVRRAVDRRDGRVCQMCGKPGNEKHHLTPLAKGGADHEANVVTLCSSCHEAAHRRLRVGP